MLPFADLDELHLKIREPMVARLFGESVISYRSGAYRGAIVTLWTAVVFDITGKLRELELGGDAQSAIHIREFESAQATQNIDSALRFERHILTLARDTFELLTHQEYDDLARLQIDRNRSAHPSMSSQEEAYSPSAELVRYHLHSAASHLFVRPPVQGKAALSRLFEEVRSTVFPREVEAATRIMAGGPLGRAKPALVRNFMVASVKAILLGPELEGQNNRPILVSIAATKALHSAAVSTIVRDELPRIVRQIPPDNISRILRLSSALSEVLDVLPDDVAGKLEEFLRNLPEGAVHTLIPAIKHPRFQAIARVKLGELTWVQLVQLVSGNPVRAGECPDIVDIVVDRYCNSGSWNMSNGLGPGAVAPLARAILPEQVKRILEAVGENVELNHAHSTKEVLLRLRDTGPLSSDQFDAYADACQLGKRYPDMFPGSAPSDNEDVPSVDETDLPF